MLNLLLCISAVFCNKQQIFITQIKPPDCEHERCKTAGKFITRAIELHSGRVRSAVIPHLSVQCKKRQT